MKVLVVDDDTLIRDGLKILLELEEDFQVVGTASNGREAFEMCQREKPGDFLFLGLGSLHPRSI